MSLFLRDCDMREEGREEQRSTVVMNMLKENIPVDVICRVAECDEVYVEEIRKLTK